MLKKRQKKETFMNNFSIFTNHLFDDWQDWENMVIIGGSVVASILPVGLVRQEPGAEEAQYGEEEHLANYFQEQNPSSDIDIYLYGLDMEAFSKKLFSIYLHLKNRCGEVLVVRTPYTITFISEFPNRHVQVVVGLWNSIEHIIFEPDIDCTCLAFNGSTLLATQRSRFSLIHRVIVTSNEKYQVRTFPEYEARLIKYSRAYNFNILDQLYCTRSISENYILFGRERLLDHLVVNGRTCVWGLRLLICLSRFPELANVDIMGVMSGAPFSENIKDPEKKGIILFEGLPYGPSWDLPSIVERIELGCICNTNYGVEQYFPQFPLYKHITDVSDHNSILLPSAQAFAPPPDCTQNNFFYDRIFQDDYDEEERVKAEYLRNHPIIDTPHPFRCAVL